MQTLSLKKKTRKCLLLFLNIPNLPKPLPSIIPSYLRCPHSLEWILHKKIIRDDLFSHSSFVLFFWNFPKKQEKRPYRHLERWNKMKKVHLFRIIEGPGAFLRIYFICFSFSVVNKFLRIDCYVCVSVWLPRRKVVTEK